MNISPILHNLEKNNVWQTIPIGIFAGLTLFFSISHYVFIGIRGRYGDLTGSG